MKAFAIAASLALAGMAAPAVAADAPPASSPAARYSSTASSIGDLVDNPATKAVLEKHLPALVGNPQIEMARSLTLKQVQGFAADLLSDDVLARIDADLAAIK